MRTIQMSLLLWALCAVPVCSLLAQGSAGVADDLKVVQQAVYPTTAVVVRLDWQRLQMPKEFRDTLASDKDLQQVVAWFGSLQPLLAKFTDDQLLMLVDVPFTSVQPVVRFAARKPAGLDVSKLNEELKRIRFSPAVIEGDLISTAPAGNLSPLSGLMVSSELVPRPPKC